MLLPTLETERLQLRAWQPEQDAVQALAIYGDRRVTDWIGDKTTAQSMAQVRDRLQRYCDRSEQAADGSGVWA
ncbi:MAG: N-acetyltransferase, partial [Cyanobacteria bacterium P01_H01_bin.119]